VRPPSIIALDDHLLTFQDPRRELQWVQGLVRHIRSWEKELKPCALTKESPEVLSVALVEGVAIHKPMRTSIVPVLVVDVEFNRCLSEE
jgi:hypothetical protein